MRLEANDAIAANHSVMDDISGQVEAVAGVEGELAMLVGEAEGNGAGDAINDLVVGVAVSGVDIMRGVRPQIGTQSLRVHEFNEGLLRRVLR